MAAELSWRPKAGEIPQQPGVYRFRDATSRVLYVGKARNLRSRLSNYFAPLATLHDRTRKMVQTASSVEWTVVGNDFEALQLEYTWIKEFDPPFNVQYKDDKSYPYLAITLGDQVPRVMVTRNKGIPNARYFGPYSRAWAIRDTVDILLKAFPMRSCSDATYKRAHQTGRPCLLGDIGKCAAPCVGRVTLEEHKSIAVDFASFMSGNDTGFVSAITRRMKEASAEQDYEAAARYRDQVEDIAQDVFLKIFRALPQFDPGRARFTTWIYTFVRNHCYDVLKKRRLPTTSIDGGPDAATPGPAWAVEGKDPLAAYDNSFKIEATLEAAGAARAADRSIDTMRPLAWRWATSRMRLVSS